jgi:hypothetical protein
MAQDLSCAPEDDRLRSTQLLSGKRLDAARWRAAVEGPRAT